MRVNEENMIFANCAVQNVCKQFDTGCMSLHLFCLICGVDLFIVAVVFVFVGFFPLLGQWSTVLFVVQVMYLGWTLLRSQKQ